METIWDTYWMGFKILMFNQYDFHQTLRFSERKTLALVSSWLCFELILKIFWENAYLFAECCNWRMSQNVWHVHAFPECIKHANDVDDDVTLDGSDEFIFIVGIITFIFFSYFFLSSHTAWSVQAYCEPCV